MQVRTLFMAERLQITALEESDASVIASWYTDAEFVRRFEATPARPKGREEIVARIIEARNSQEDYLFGFRLRGADALVGWGALDQINWRNRVAWLALALGPDHWGRGLGGEALHLLLVYAFRELGMHRVQLTVFANNGPAIRLYERAGFCREGVYREFLLRDGKRVDMLLMGMLAHEWAELEDEVSPS